MNKKLDEHRVVSLRVKIQEKPWIFEECSGGNIRKSGNLGPPISTPRLRRIRIWRRAEGGGGVGVTKFSVNKEMKIIVEFMIAQCVIHHIKNQ